MPDEDALVAEIVAERSRGMNDAELGRVVCQIRDISVAERGVANDRFAQLDAFVAAELAPATGLPSPVWHALTDREALIVLVLALTESLGAERIALTRGVSLARGFLDCFSPAVKSFTNREYRFAEDVFDLGRSRASRSALRGGWTASGWPLLGGLEQGLIAVDERRIGILWVTDED